MYLWQYYGYSEQSHFSKEKTNDSFSFFFKNVNYELELSLASWPNIHRIPNLNENNKIPHLNENIRNIESIQHLRKKHTS